MKKTLFHKQARRLLTVCLLASLVAVGCSISPRERSNPLDPVSPVELFQLSLTLIDTVIDTDSVRRVQLNWQNIDHVALIEYHVYRRLPVQADGFVLRDITLPPLTTFTDMDAVPEDPYFFRVIALMGDGTDSVFSEEVSYQGRFDDRY